MKKPRIREMVEPVPYSHRAWLASRRRQCPRCGLTQPMMRIHNLDGASTRMEQLSNGFIYKEWPYYRCRIHNLLVAL